MVKMLKCTGDVRIDIMTKGSVYIPLHWKRDAADENCNNYQIISLLNHASEVISHISQEHLKSFPLSQILPEEFKAN